MTDRETAIVTMARLDDPAVEPEQVEVYVDDGTPVDPQLRERHMGTPASEPPAPGNTITVTRAELADMIATAAAAAVAAQQSTAATTAEIRQAARTALTQEVL
ncbi:MAG: hypothetical protein M3Y83_04740 [Actinomycetota bacterium]|nr:hypothetical protein [Actinomycetota bacterium]